MRALLLVAFVCAAFALVCAAALVLRSTSARADVSVVGARVGDEWLRRCGETFVAARACAPHPRRERRRRVHAYWPTASTP